MVNLDFLYHLVTSSRWDGGSDLPVVEYKAMWRAPDGLDAVIGMLTAAGVASVLVHGGSSSVRAIGLQGPALPGRRGWRVGGCRRRDPSARCSLR